MSEYGRPNQTRNILLGILAACLFVLLLCGCCFRPPVLQTFIHS